MTVLTSGAVNKDIKRKRKNYRQSLSYFFKDFLMFCQIFFSQQVKQCAFITYKRGIHELPHELQNDRRLKILVT